MMTDTTKNGTDTDGGKNPLAEVRIGTSSAISDAKRLVNVLVDPKNSDRDKGYFSEAGRVWLCAAILHVLVRANKENKPTPNFANIADFMSVESFNSSYASMMKYDHGDIAIDNFVKNKATYMRSMPDKQRSGILFTAIADTKSEKSRTGV